MSIMLKKEIKQKTKYKTRNKQIRKSLKEDIDRLYYQVIKIKKKRFDTYNKKLI